VEREGKKWGVSKEPVRGTGLRVWCGAESGRVWKHFAKLSLLHWAKEF